MVSKQARRWAVAGRQAVGQAGRQANADTEVSLQADTQLGK